MLFLIKNLDKNPIFDLERESKKDNKSESVIIPSTKAVPFVVNAPREALQRTHGSAWPPRPGSVGSIEKRDCFSIFLKFDIFCIN